MCTAISFQPKDHYFGRNLDLERSYGEQIIITPRNFPLIFRSGFKLHSHNAIIGIGITDHNYPLYFEAVNEKGLCLAELNFPENANYLPYSNGKANIAPFELIPFLLGKCDNLQEAEILLHEMNLWDISFSEALPQSPLHWLLCDQTKSLTVEPTATGLKIYENPFGVLTNNPPFPYHIHNLTNYMPLTHRPPTNNQPITFSPYSLGLGSFGLPGDMSSGSRFVKAAFTKMHSLCDEDEASCVSQFFHILSSVTQPKGLTQLENGEYEYTQYSSCCNASKGLYYYTTYLNSSIISVDMHLENLNSNTLVSYPLIKNIPFLIQNKHQALDSDM